MNAKKILIAMSILVVLLAGTALSAGAATPMHVASFRTAYSNGHIKANVRVVDALQNSVSGAKVQVSFEKEGTPTKLRTGVTNLNGRVSISDAVSAGKWHVCVEEIHKLGYTYNPAKNLCTTVTVP